MFTISSFCRTCMVNVGAKEMDVHSCNIFETEGLADKLMLCSNIEIQPYDEYPPRVCNKCYIKIHVLCGFQEMCRESLKKFNKMLERQTKTGDDTSVEVSEDRLTNTTDIESKFDHYMILGDVSNDKQKDTEEEIEIKFDHDGVDNDPLAVKQLITCEHDYSQAAVTRPLVRCSEKSEDKKGDASGEVTEYEDERRLDYNMLKINCSANKSFSEILVSTSDASAKTIPITLPCNTTGNTNIANLPTENTFSDKICVKNGAAQLFKNLSDEREVNKTQLENVDFENEVEPIFKDIEVGKEPKEAQFENGDCENEEEYIFKGLSENEDDNRKRRTLVSADAANEDYLFASPSEDKVIYSGSDTVLYDSKPTTVKCHKYSCDLCPKTFILEQRLITHKRRHQGFMEYPCSRENCTLSYNRLIDLRQHLRDHDGIPRQIYKCPMSNCGLKYTTKNSLQLHLRKHHNRGPALPARKFVCEACGKVYQHARSLRVHQYIHVDESLWPFKCDFEGCSKKFRSNSYYKIHKNRHYGIKPYACTICDKRFCSDTNLQAHFNFHTLEKKWICMFCPTVCYMPASLRLHIRIKHENHPDAKNFPCRFCNKILSTSTGRKCHERKHTGERPFVCEECGRGYTNASSLKNHMQTHLSDGDMANKFRCRVCDQTMTTAISLKYHEMIHTGEKPFECVKCGVKFRYQSNLARHTKQKLCRKPKATEDKGGTEKSQMNENAENNVNDTQ